MALSSPSPPPLPSTEAAHRPLLNARSSPTFVLVQSRASLTGVSPTVHEEGSLLQPPRTPQVPSPPGPSTWTPRRGLTLGYAKQSSDGPVNTAAQPSRPCPALLLEGSTACMLSTPPMCLGSTATVAFLNDSPDLWCPQAIRKRPVLCQRWRKGGPAGGLGVKSPPRR